MLSPQNNLQPGCLFGRVEGQITLLASDSCLNYKEEKGKGLHLFVIEE